MPAAFLWQLDAVSLGASRLRDVTLTIEPGTTALVGWSGAGKTSLLNVLAEFEPPDRGTICGAPRIAWAPQGAGLWHHCAVREHLEIVGAGPVEVAALLADFGLTARRDARPAELSQGERSRLAMARALAVAADVYLLDEPLAHLDPTSAPATWRRIRERIAARGASLVYATHAPETVIADATAAICLREGRVLHQGSAAELYARPPSAELMAFLGAGNWFTPDDARHWLGAEWTAAACIRPEQLVAEPVETGGFPVISARFMGSVAELELAAPNGPRTFYHRPRTATIAAEARVRLRVLAP